MASWVTMTGTPAEVESRRPEPSGADAVGSLAQPALWVVADLARHAGRAIAVSELSDRYLVSGADLDRILTRLAEAGMVRAAGGRWEFSGNPRRISLHDVAGLFPPPAIPAPAGAQTAIGLEVTRRLREARRLADTALRTVTIETLLDQVRAEADPARPARPASPLGTATK